MGYKKLIRSGNLVETYEYKYDLSTTLKLQFRQARIKGIKRIDRRKDNIGRLRQAFIRLVRTNIDRNGSPAFFTFTFQGIVGITQAWRCFYSFARRARHRIGYDFSYICVPEFQKRGSVHFHALCWGLDEYVKREAVLREIQHLWGYGFIDCFFTDGSIKLAGYIAKYMQKAVFDPRLLGRKAYSASRNVLRPMSIAYQTAFTFLDELVGVDNLPCKVDSYDTMYLGRCVYKQYII